MSHWILVGQTPIEVDLEEWSRWFEKNRDTRIVKQENVEVRGMKYWVSTVFLGLDHGFGRDTLPILFETMVFTDDEPWNNYEQRWRTYDEAERGHQLICMKVLAKKKP